MCIYTYVMKILLKALTAFVIFLKTNFEVVASEPIWSIIIFYFVLAIYILLLSILNDFHLLLETKIKSYFKHAVNCCYYRNMLYELKNMTFYKALFNALFHIHFPKDKYG